LRGNDFLRTPGRGRPRANARSLYDPENRHIVVHTLGAVRDAEALPALAAVFGRIGRSVPS